MNLYAAVRNSLLSSIDPLGLAVYVVYGDISEDQLNFYRDWNTDYQDWIREAKRVLESQKHWENVERKFYWNDELLNSKEDFIERLNREVLELIPAPFEKLEGEKDKDGKVIEGDSGDIDFLSAHVSNPEKHKYDYDITVYDHEASYVTVSDPDTDAFIRTDPPVVVYKKGITQLSLVEKAVSGLKPANGGKLEHIVCFKAPYAKETTSPRHRYRGDHPKPLEYEPENLDGLYDTGFVCTMKWWTLEVYGERGNGF